MWVTIISVLGSFAVFCLGFMLILIYRRLPTTSHQLAPLPHDFHSRLSQLEADLASTRRQLTDLERSTELGLKSMAQRIVRSGRRSRSEEDEELAELGRQAIQEAIASPQDRVIAPLPNGNVPQDPPRTPRVVRAR